MAKVLVTGATGLLGNTLMPLLRARGHAVQTHGRSSPADFNGDLSSAQSTVDMLECALPDVIVNLAALTNVDQCESRPDEAYRLNALPAVHLCRWIAQRRPSCHLIHISTDHVYDGSGPQDEDQIVIRNHYAMSKMAGEHAAAAIPATILRTNFFGRSACAGRNSFTDWLYTALSQGQPIKVFEDVFFSPLSMATLTDMIERTVQARPAGTYNLGAREGMSKADFAYAFAAALDLPTASMTRSAALPAAAPRPKDMRMACARFEQRMGLTLPRLSDEIALLREHYPRFVRP